MKYKVIDIHTHSYPEVIAQKAAVSLGEFYNFNVECAGTYSDLENQAKESHSTDTSVVGFLLLAVATNSHQVQKANDSVAAFAATSRKNGFETVGFAGIHQDYTEIEDEVDRCAAIGLRGFKIHPDIQRLDLLDGFMFSLCEVLEDRHLPLFLHMGDDREEFRFSEPKKLARLLDRFPRLEVVAAHFGGYRAWEEARAYVYGRPNVWYDISSALWAMTAEHAKYLINACGADRVMFGTDYPVMTLKNYIDLFMKIELDEKTREDIFYNNAKRFLGF